LILGSLERPEFVVGNEEHKVQLRYAPRGIRGIGPVEKHLQYGEMYSGRNTAIVDPSGRALLEPKTATANRELTEDYLLVTRVPGLQPGTTATILSGLHGPGTRAAELLFTPSACREFDILAGFLKWDGKGPLPWFQAVFRAFHFEELSGSWVPRRIECLRDQCPPICLKSLK
jgi:hypothetical protein